MIVVHHLIVGRSLFTVWLLEELGLEYELETYHRLPTRRAPPELKEVHPLGKSPVIVDDGLVIAESGAIASYLLERHDTEHRLSVPISDHQARAAFLQWLHYPEGSAFAPLSLVMLGQMSDDPLPALVGGFAQSEAALQLAYIADSLGERPFILGNEFSACDVGLGYIVSLAERLGLLDDYPTLQTYLQRLQARPAYQRALERSGG